MGARVKAMTVLATMALTFAILPTFGASAAEPLPDGDYAFVVAEELVEFTVLDGDAFYDVRAGIELDFEEKDGDVVGEIEVRVDDGLWKVEIKDGKTEVTPLGTVPVLTAPPPAPVDTETETEPATTSDEPVEEEPAEEDAGDEGEPATTATDEASHGDIVSYVAQCAPRGRDAKDARLPTHGYFVSAAATGASISFEFGDVTEQFDLSDMPGAEEFCGQVDRLLEGPVESTEEPEDTGTTGAEETDATENEDRGNGNGNGGGPDKDTGRPDHAGPKGRGNG